MSLQIWLYNMLLLLVFFVLMYSLWRSYCWAFISSVSRIANARFLFCREKERTLKWSTVVKIQGLEVVLNCLNLDVNKNDSSLLGLYKIKTYWLQVYIQLHDSCLGQIHICTWCKSFFSGVKVFLVIFKQFEFRICWI